MITVLMSLGQVNGAWAGLLGIVLSAAAYLALCFAFSRNRGQGRRRVWYFLLLTEVVCDIFWRFYYFPGGEYVNHGLGGMAAMFAWPLLLAVSFVVVMAINGDRED